MYKIIKHLGSTNDTIIIDEVESIFRSTDVADLYLYNDNDPLNTYHVLGINRPYGKDYEILYDAW